MYVIVFQVLLKIRLLYFVFGDGAILVLILILYRYLTGYSGEIVHLQRTLGEGVDCCGTCTVVVVSAAGMMRVAEQPERSSIIFSSTRHLLNGDKKKI